MQGDFDLIGLQLGKYRLIKLLGKGGHARVYLGEHISLHNKAAIKVLRSIHTQEERNRFLGEARLVAKLSHPHIVRLMHFDIEENLAMLPGGVPYLVMTWAERGSLRQAYPEGTVLPLDKIVLYLNQVADALQYAHNGAHQVVHLDVKPENMLIASTDDIMLSDFGIAVSGHITTAFPSQQNPQAEVIGTVAYIAPERLQGQERRASDQYSLAVVVYEWLTGAPPFVGDKNAVMMQHLTRQPPPIHARFPHISSEVEAVVMKALEKEPNDRYPSVKEFALAFEKAVQNQLAGQPKVSVLASAPSSVPPHSQSATQPKMGSSAITRPLNQPAEQLQPNPQANIPPSQLAGQPQANIPPSQLAGQPQANIPPSQLAGQPQANIPSQLAGQPQANVPSSQHQPHWSQWAQPGQAATTGPANSQTVPVPPRSNTPPPQRATNNGPRYNGPYDSFSSAFKELFDFSMPWMTKFRGDKRLASMREYRRYRNLNYLTIVFCGVGLLLVLQLHLWFVIMFLPPVMIWIFYWSVQRINPWAVLISTSLVSLYYGAFFWLLALELYTFLPPNDLFEPPGWFIGLIAFGISFLFNRHYAFKRRRLVRKS
jgi:serine/threonine protein kinase